MERFLVGGLGWGYRGGRGISVGLSEVSSLARGWERPAAVSAGGFCPTRREFLIGAGGLLLLGVAGCGGEGAGGSGPSEETRTIEHRYGSTEVSGRPERVVSVGYTDQDPLLALGVTPVGVREWFGEQPSATWPWARDELGEATPDVLQVAELNFEQIAGLEPDLIVGVYSGLTGEEYETLSEIAPTIAQPGEYADYNVPWQEVTRILGRALGEEERAEELVSGVEARFERVRQERPEFEGASGVVALTGADGTYSPFGPEDSRGRFLSALGFEVPQEIADLAGDDFFANISAEELGLVDADVLIWITNNEEELQNLEEEPVYQRLRVAEEGRDIFLNSSEQLAGALSLSTVLSLPYLLDELVPRMAAALDGDPGTTG